MYKHDIRERCLRAERMNARQTVDSFELGDAVYFWKEPNQKGIPGWRGPGNEIGIGKSLVIVQWGGGIFRMHPLHVTLVFNSAPEGEEISSDPFSDSVQPSAETVQTEIVQPVV